MKLAAADTLGLVVNNMPIFFPEELKQWSGGEWTQYPLASVEGVCHDTRSLIPGNLYVALVGEQTDGHRFVVDAFGKGASAALVNEHFATHYMGDQPLLLVPDTLAGLLDLARGYVRSLDNVRVGITGSVGKTTVKEMLADILARQASTGRTRGNWNNQVGLPLSLLNAWRDDHYGVFELGINHPGEMAPLCDVLQPQVGIMTAVGAAHIEFFESEEAIAREKAKLLRTLPTDGLAVLDADDRWYDIFCADSPCRVAAVSMSDRGAYRGRADGRQLRVTEATGEVQILNLSLPGEHIMRDALLAYAAGRELGVPPEAAAEALSQFRALPMRWHVQDIDGVQVINDSYNANPISMQAALDTFRAEPTAGTRWAVLGGMYELGAATEAEHRQLGTYAADGPWNLVAVGPLGQLIAEGAAAAGHEDERIFRCRETAEAGALLRERTTPGDSVLLKASRGERFEHVIEHWRHTAP